MAVGKPASLGTADGAHDRLLVEAAQSDPARFADLYELTFETVYGGSGLWRSRCWRE